MGNNNLMIILRDELSNFVKSLPYLGPEDVQQEESCPICLNLFTNILKGRAASEAPGGSVEESVEDVVL